MMLAPTRTTRSEPGRSRLMPRELEALVFIAEAQPVVTSAYQEFLGVSLSVARRSLRKLRDLGLINVFVRSLETPSHFTLTKRAAVLLAEELDRPVEEFRTPRGIGRFPLNHHDGVVQLAAALRRACRLSQGCTVAAFQFEEAIRSSLGVGKSAQVPDAVAVLEAADGERLAWAIEQDQATQSVNCIVETKAKPYAELQAKQVPLLGTNAWRVVCVVPSEQRLKRLVTALYEAGIPQGQWYFAVRGEIRAETVLTSAWRTVRTTPEGDKAELVPEVPLPRKAVITNGPHREDREAA